MSIMDIALTVKRVVAEEYPERAEIGIEVTPTDDIRSYHVNSDKIRRVLGFQPARGVEDAARDLVKAFEVDKLPDSMANDWYYNVRYLKAKKVA